MDNKDKIFQDKIIKLLETYQSINIPYKPLDKREWENHISLFKHCSQCNGRLYNNWHYRRTSISLNGSETTLSYICDSCYQEEQNRINYKLYLEQEKAKRKEKRKLKWINFKVKAKKCVRIAYIVSIWITSILYVVAIAYLTKVYNLFWLPLIGFLFALFVPIGLCKVFADEKNGKKCNWGRFDRLRHLCYVISYGYLNATIAIIIIFFAFLMIYALFSGDFAASELHYKPDHL